MKELKIFFKIRQKKKNQSNLEESQLQYPHLVGKHVILLI